MSKESPKILYWDIETAPAEARIFTLKPKQYISHQQVTREPHIICIGYMWEGDKEATVIYGDEEEMLREISEQLNKADYIVHHYGDRFDLPWVRARLLKYKLPPLPKFTTYNSVDTKKVAKKEFFLMSYRLDYIGQYLGLGNKIETGGFSLWNKVMNGDKTALKNMITYCGRDVELLRDVFQAMKPHVTRLPNWNLFLEDEDPRCTSCGSKRLQRRGYQVSATSKKQRVQCQDCGKWHTIALSRGKTNIT